MSGEALDVVFEASGTSIASAWPAPRASALVMAARPCAWCAAPVTVVCRPGRPRLYCHQGCRQRAYEHRHGFVHQRTVRSLPGQASGYVWRGSGYERGGWGLLGSKVHAMRTSVRPEGRRRESLCGLLVEPVGGQHFMPTSPRACDVCRTVVASNPLTVGISVSNELSRLRAVIEETGEARLDPAAAFRWLVAASCRPPAMRAAA